jgi:acyl-coenzyme A synthetase/AMP-(fatty) acid ligase
MKIGAVPVPVSTMAIPGDYLYFLNDSRAKVLIVAQDLASTMRGIRSKLRYLKHFVVVGQAEAGELNCDSLLETAPDFQR